MTRLFRLLKTDAQLIAAIKQGNDSALGILYSRYLRMIIKYMLDNNGSEEEAKEYLQDALVILWEKVMNNEFEIKAKISTFLYAVIKNRWISELARRKKFTNFDNLNPDTTATASVESEIQENETTEIVKKCMAQLDPLCRKILTYYYYDQKSMAQISRLTGLANENVAKTKKYQCKKALEELVRKAMGESIGVK